MKDCSDDDESVTNGRLGVKEDLGGKKGRKGVISVAS